MSDELSKQIVLLEKLLKKEENKFCADCRRKSPSWASITAGVFICIKCAGFHRELGVHITKIKSVNLDKWPKGVANLFTKINNKIANSYWESKMPEQNFEKLQNDEYRLFDLVKDKYERKRWCAKGKDPMTLIYEGKEPEVQLEDKKRKKSDDSEDSDRAPKHKKTHSQVITNNSKNLPNFSSTSKESQLKNQSSANSANIIDFSANVQGTSKISLPDDMFIPVVEDESTFKKNENNFNLGQKSSGSSGSSGFSFINKTNHQNHNQNQNQNQNQNSSLIDLQSYESQKSNQLKQLTENISSIYNNPSSNDSKQNPQARNMNYTQMNQPNINISNTFYNMNGVYPNNTGMGLNMMQGGMYPNQMMNQGMGMNPINSMNSMNQINPNNNFNSMNGMNGMNGTNNPYMNRMPQPSSQPMGMPNNPSFNYDYYNNINGQKANSSTGFNMGGLGNISDLNSGSSLGGHAYTNKKKEDDPFKKLVHFK